jgi:hypothetical protein
MLAFTTWKRGGIQVTMLFCSGKKLYLILQKYLIVYERHSIKGMYHGNNMTGFCPITLML